MEDTQIINLNFPWIEQVNQEKDNKYGGYCYFIANSLRMNRASAEVDNSDCIVEIWIYIEIVKEMHKVLDT